MILDIHTEIQLIRYVEKQIQNPIHFSIASIVLDVIGEMIGEGTTNFYTNTKQIEKKISPLLKQNDIQLELFQLRAIINHSMQFICQMKIGLEEIHLN